MPEKLTEIQLFAADKSGQIGQIIIPGSDGILDYLVKNPFIREKLGEEDQLTLEIKSGTLLATATSADDYELTQGKILRFIYDDSSIMEWRITQGSRDFSGSQDVIIKAKPVYTDISRRIVRKTLSTGQTRSAVSFYKQTVESVLTSLLSSAYNCPAYITLGTISNDVKKVEIDGVLVDRTISMTLNAEYLMNAIAQVCDLSGAEWYATYDNVEDAYELNFVAEGMIGGGSSEATDRLITMGGDRSNRLEMVRRDEDENYFSRVIPTAGQSNEVIGIGDLKFDIASKTYIEPVGELARTGITLKEPLILKDEYGDLLNEDVFFGVNGNWYEVIKTVAETNTIWVLSDATSLSDHGYLKIGASKDEMIFLEDRDAVQEVGEIEEKYVRTDISPYENIAESLGVSVAASEWSAGLPVGFAKINGAETVAEETNEIYTLHGGKAAKVSCDADQGIETIDLDITPEDLSPYFSISAYLRCESGSVRVEVVDSLNNVYPENAIAETSLDVTRVLQIGGMELPDDVVKIRFVAQEAGTVFYFDALTFTQSATPINFTPLMGKKALWLEASRYLKKFSGDRPDVWTGSVMDESWFGDVVGAKEISVGSYVTVQEDYNEGTGEFDTEIVLRVIELSYHESPEDGRYKKNIRLSESKPLISNALNENYVRSQSLQNVQSVEATPERPTYDDQIITDHGQLTGLGDDDHPQYFNEVRGDDRYYTKALADQRYLRGDQNENITGEYTFAPPAAQAPFYIGVNGQGQLVNGLNADQLDGYHAAAMRTNFNGTPLDLGGNVILQGNSDITITPVWSDNSQVQYNFSVNFPEESHDFYVDGATFVLDGVGNIQYAKEMQLSYYNVGAQTSKPDIPVDLGPLYTDLDSRFAASSHTHSASAITSGELPIVRGGTNATTATQARTNLGVTEYQFGSTALDFGGNVTFFAGSNITISKQVNSSSDIQFSFSAASGTDTWVDGGSFYTNSAGAHTIGLQLTKSGSPTADINMGALDSRYAELSGATFSGTVNAPTILANGQIAVSSAALQVNGFMRTGNIYLHEGGNTPTSGNAVLGNTLGNLEWAGNAVWHEGNLTSNSQLTNGAGYYMSGSNVVLGTVEASYFRNNSSNSNYNIFTRSGGNYAVYIQQVDATGDIARFLYGSSTAGAGTAAFTIKSSEVVSGVIIKGPEFEKTSDRRLKSTILQLTGYEFRHLNPVSFTKNDRHSFGFIAQEIKKYYPSLVTKGEDGYYTLAQDHIVAMNTAGLQKVDSEVDQLKKEVSHLKNESQEFKRRCRELEQELLQLKGAA
jgi:hypothetical protein